MNSLSSIFVFAFLSILTDHVNCQNQFFFVARFGAVANGKTDSRQAFERAWKRACKTPGGVLVVPGGRTFMVSGADFVGPCNGPTTFRMDGNIIASNDIKVDHLEYWISFDSIDWLRLVGQGVFHGNGALAWARCGESSHCSRRPASLRFHDVRNALIQGITSLHSKMFHFQIHRVRNMRITNVLIHAPASSRNTDGIHIGNSQQVHITDSIIATGDDCVSLGDGSKEIEISGITCGPGHGISIGSLGKYDDEEDVHDINVRNCTLKNTDNGLRIKTWAPSRSSTLVSNVTFADINLFHVLNPIIIDQYYCPSGKCKKKGESGVKITGVKYINVRGSSATPMGVDVQCSKKNPCEDVDFSGINLTVDRQPTIALCSNYNGRFKQSMPSGCS